MKPDSLSGFIDIHSHFLPGLDDGPENSGQCLETAKRYLEIGVSCLIATPHCMHGTRWVPSPEMIAARIAEIEKTLFAHGISLSVLPGMEIAASDLLGGHFPPTDFLSLGNSGTTFLIEFPLHSPLSRQNDMRMHKLLPGLQGQRCIIAHPERCAMFINNIGRARELVEQGMLIQVNIGSLLGTSGPQVGKTALELFRAGLVHFLATDSHGRGDRLPPDPTQMTQLRRILGDDAVAIAFQKNPRPMREGG